ncbi:helix-turn-helix transcriptional regulator [Kaistella rhinocerotis]|uniref:helix-turn-helix transcriptional regulator n=1 Tax=Kaistella rhinocerotis TaxID=3026437 RepID=UPI002555E748|nr:helix-turn-helix transcriptional regulator [Kaistella sp. Ran72]
MANTDTAYFSNRLKSEILENRVKTGSSLRAIRENRGWSQEQLAEKMNISRSTISKIESGKFNCSIDYLAKFASFLDFEIILQDSQQTL